MTETEMKQIIAEYNHLCGAIYRAVDKARPDFGGEFNVRPFVYNHAGELDGKLGVCVMFPTKNEESRQEEYMVVPWEDVA